MRGKNIFLFAVIFNLLAIPGCQSKPAIELDFSGSRLEVIINGKSYANNSTYNWGNVSSGATITVQGQLRNQAPFTATLTGTTAITLSGDHASDIVLTQPASNTIAAPGTQDFSFTITPQALQTRSAKFTIVSSPGNDVFTLNLSGYRYGTMLVKDINPGAGSSAPIRFTMIGSKLYFAATDGTNGIEPWISDGTTAGTKIIANINSGSADSDPRSFTQFNSAVYFQADESASGKELWRTDGTTGGTYLVRDIQSGTGDSSPSDFCEFNGYLYFSGDTATTGNELWRTDGTYIGTTMLANLNSGIANGNGGNMFVHSSTRMIFSGNDGATGYEPYKTDGTSISIVQNLDGSGSNSSPSSFFAFSGATVFKGNSQLWKITSASATSATLVKNINPSRFTIFGDNLIFEGLDGTNGSEIWMSDSTLTSGGTNILKDINPGTGNSNPNYFTVLGSKLLFSACETATDCELWITDGTALGTVRIKDINPGTGASSSPSFLVAIGNVVYFSANDGVNGAELWRSDGTAAGTYMVEDINPGATGSSPTGMKSFGAGFYFAATTAANGAELYMYVPPP